MGIRKYIQKRGSRFLSLIFFLNTSSSSLSISSLFLHFYFFSTRRLTKGKLLLSLPKPPMKLLVDGLPHQMDHTHGVTVSLKNKVTPATTVHQVVNGLVHLEGNILDEANPNFIISYHNFSKVMAMNFVGSNYVNFDINEHSNYNYGPCGRAIGVDLLNNPDLVATDPVISFKSAIWFWMTPQSPKPSCHNVITGRWKPSGADRAANRLPGFSVITNIINGGLECGRGSDSRVQNRIGFYRRYCKILGVSPGYNLDCGNQRSFGNGLLVDSM